MERKFILKRVITLCVLLLLISGLFFVQLSIAHQGSMNLPNATVLRSEKGLNLTFSDTLSVKAQTAAMNQSEGTISSEISDKYTKVNLYKTTSSYGKIIPLDIVRGSYFVDAKTPIVSRYIVISNSLAIKYFQTDNVVGFPLLVDDISYIICGVYHENGRLLNRLAGNGLQTVFLPAQSSVDIDTLPVHELYIDMQAQFLDKVIDEITTSTRKPPLQDSVSVYGDIKKILAQAPKVTLFFVAVLVSISMIWIAILQLRCAYYAKKGDDRKHMMVHLGVATLLVIVGIVLLWITRFSFFLPSAILPDDNIFDIKHYVDVVVFAVNRHNSFSLYDYHWNYSFLIMWNCMVTAIATMLVVVLSWLYGVMKVKKFFKIAANI